MIPLSTYLSFQDVALSNFAKALALPVRVCIIRFILENDNHVNREMLTQIPFKSNSVNKHINDLKYLGIIKSNVKDRVNFFSVDEAIFIQMSNHFLNLFEPLRQLNADAERVFSVNKIKKKKSPAKEKQLQPLGKFIKERRKALGFSQEQFSAKIQLSRARLSNIECGITNINLDKLDIWADALNVSSIDLTKMYYNDKADKIAIRLNQLSG